MLMKMRELQHLVCFFFITLMAVCHVSVVASYEKQTYIVHIEEELIPTSFSSPEMWYQSLLNSVSDSKPDNRTIIYTYSTVLQGFSTSLTAAEAESLKGNPSVLAVHPEEVYQPDTTRTPYFLDLHGRGGLLPRSRAGNNVIIGVLDTGIWPESKSFDDRGLGPVPSKWKGSCMAGTNFTAGHCNRKLIGAQFFSAGYEAARGRVNEQSESRSPRDDQGHGTHTASTAGGAPVRWASMSSYARGTAQGMATSSRIAAYKVCWVGGCFSSDILAAMDKAVQDGVDVLSLSLSNPLQHFYVDSIAIGAFAAVQQGILVSCSAGNTGPSFYTVRNVAPWIMTVGASSIDRDFPSYAILGNLKVYISQSLYPGSSLPNWPALPLIYAGNASNYWFGKYCPSGSLISAKVKGKIVLCENGNTSVLQMGLAVRAAGGAGVIIANELEDGSQLDLEALPHFIPTVTVSSEDGADILRYIFSNPTPKATIVTGKTIVGVRPSPVIARFSSRGPNSITPEILKPDVIAPGLNILAAWSGSSGPTGISDERRVEFNIISGTSMSCPHVSGLAALLKGAHPNWSPAAIKSALMTTSYSAYPNGQPLLDSATGNSSSPLVYGAGHVVPQKALDPGLVYDITADDYLNFLCGIGYSEQQIAVVARRRFTCRRGARGLNYPSFVVQFPVGSSGPKSISFTRTVTNVGGSWSSYSVSVSSPYPVKTVVHPQVLRFKRVGQMMSYSVTFTSSTSLPSGTFRFGHLEWSDRGHRVRSPIVFTWV